MGKHIILFSITATMLVIVAISILPRLLDGIVFFLLAGIVPGTSHVIGAGWMFVISLGLFGFVVSNLAARYVQRRLSDSGHKAPTFADNLPWKRFNRI